MRVKHGRLCLLLLLLACGDELSTGPNERSIAIQGTEAWSGGQYRVSVEFGADEEPPLRVILDGEPLTVTRVDGVTFLAQLPTLVGDFPLRVEGEDLGPFEITLTLHGFRNGGNGPPVGGAVVARAVNGGHIVLGSTFEGAAEVSLATGQVVRAWPLAMHSVRCSGGIAPGPVAGQVIVRGALGAEEQCEYYRARTYNSAGLGTVTNDGFSSAYLGLSAMVGPLTGVWGAQDSYGEFGRCTVPGEPWSGCDLPIAVNVYGGLVGYQAGYVARRILPLATRTALHDLQTGNIVAQLPQADAGSLRYTAAAFSNSEDTLYAAAVRSGEATGKVFALNASTGTILDGIEVPDGSPLAVAVDDLRKLVLVVVADLEAEQVWLRVISRVDHEHVIDIAVDNQELAATIVGHFHHQLVLDAARRELTLVSTARVRYFQDTPIEPMVIARWTLP